MEQSNHQGSNNLPLDRFVTRALGELDKNGCTRCDAAEAHAWRLLTVGLHIRPQRIMLSTSGWSPSLSRSWACYCT
jgi:hypothetical protein